MGGSATYDERLSGTGTTGEEVRAPVIFTAGRNDL